MASDKKIMLTTAFNPDDADPATGKTCLVAALEAPKTTLKDVYDILCAGVDPDQPNLEGVTPMDAALNRGWYAAADLLIKAGATPPKYDGDPDGPLEYKPQGMRYKDVEDEMKRETPLTYYVKKADFRHIYPILANGADINKKNSMDETPLEAAVNAREWPYLTRQLVRRGAWLDPDKKDPDEIVDRKTGATRLLLMIQEGTDATDVLRVLEDGANPDKPDNYGLTPLALARAMKWPAVEKMLLERGANPDVKFPDPNQTLKDGKSTPLLVYAAVYQNCHVNYFNALIEAGAKVDAADAEGKTAAWLTAMHGDEWRLYRLQEAGADLLKGDKDGTSPLHIAALNRHAAIVERILDARPEGIDLGMKDKRTPLILAAGRENNDEVCQLLIERGANVKAASDHGATALYEAAYAAKPEFIRQLIDLGADVNAVTKDGTTAMVEAIRGDKPESLKVLLEAGASIDTANKGKHYRPLFMLMNHTLKHKPEMAQLLLDHGADPNMRGSREANQSEQGDVLHCAFNWGEISVAEALLKAGADPHATGYNGKSAMHECVERRSVKSCKMLLDYGFDPLRVFDYTVRWTGGGGTGDERHLGSAYDRALELAKKQPETKEYSKIVELIEEHLLKPVNDTSPKRKRAPTP